MTRIATTIDVFDRMHASQPEYRALFAFTTRMRAEMMPDDTPTPYDEAVAAWRGFPEATQTTFWVARAAAGAIVGRAHLAFAIFPEQAHLASGGIQVLAEHRRQGHARQLLAPIAAAMRQGNRTRLVADTTGRVPAGAAFAERIGGTRGLESHVNQLRVARLDRDLVRRWIARGEALAAEFELGRWDGAYPEADLEAIAELHQVMNTQPLGTLASAAARMTPEKLRMIEAALAPRGLVRRTLYVRHRPTGRFAGYTETLWKPSAPEMLQQGDTGVFPEHRGRGLGSWLKAAMLERALRERPEIQLVRTGNADVNEPMLAINRALGFEPYVSRTIWEASVEAIERYRAGAPEGLGRAGTA